MTDFILINQKKIPIHIRKSDRAKRMSLRIDDKKPEVLLTLPHFALKLQINHFIKKQSDWIEKNWNRALEISNKRLKHSYSNGDLFFYLGDKVQLKILASQFKRKKARIRGDVLEIRLYRYTKASEAKSMIKKTVEDFYKKKASEVIYDRLSFYNEHYQLKYNRVSFRNQKTRWGSCSSAKNLNFNWRLIMAPIEIIDYVVVHELCHLKEMNHSSKFWGHVAEIVPNHKERKKWLKENNYLLSLE